MLYKIGKVELDSILDMSIFFFLPDFDKIYYFVLQEIINPLKQKEEWPNHLSQYPFLQTRYIAV